jgi:hypothetical protein
MPVKLCAETIGGTPEAVESMVCQTVDLYPDDGQAVVEVRNKVQSID